MSILFWVPFLFASPPHDTCSMRGTPLLEITDLSETDPAKHSTTKIFESGAWTTGRERGCFDQKALRTIRRAVQRASWKEAPSAIRCFAYDPNFTEYRVHGELRVTLQMCSGKATDDGTMRAIELVKRELAEDNEVDATPLFEIRKRSALNESTSTIAIYGNGAWVNDGKTGQFDKQTMKSLQSVIEQSPWETTKLRLVCRAYSPSFTEYYVNGKLEYTARMCGAERLDEKSLGAIKIIEDAITPNGSPKLPATAL